MTSMNSSSWRKWTRVLAYCELYLNGCLATVFATWAIVGFGTLTVGPLKPRPSTNSSMTDNETLQLAIENAILLPMQVCGWKVLMVILAMAMLIQLWAGYQLLNATELDRQLKEASKMATAYRTVMVNMVILQLILSLWLGRYWCGSIYTVIRIGFLYPVWQFNKELKSQLASHSQQEAHSSGVAFANGEDPKTNLIE